VVIGEGFGGCSDGILGVDVFGVDVSIVVAGWKGGGEFLVEVEEVLVGGIESRMGVVVIASAKSLTGRVSGEGWMGAACMVLLGSTNFSKNAACFLNFWA
jgi:hypothetical protein